MTETVNLTKLARGRLTINIQLSGVRTFTFRLRAAILIMRLAGAISPVDFVIHVEDGSSAKV